MIAWSCCFLTLPLWKDPRLFHQKCEHKSQDLVDMFKKNPRQKRQTLQFWTFRCNGKKKRSEKEEINRQLSSSAEMYRNRQYFKPRRGALWSSHGTLRLGSRLGKSWWVGLKSWDVACVQILILDQSNAFLELICTRINTRGMNASI